MRRPLLLYLILLVVLYPTTGIRAADGICACYYDELGYCEYFYDDASGVPFSDPTECVAYCDDTFGEAVVDTDFAEDSDSEGGISVGADCDESDEAAVAAAAVADSSSSSSSTSNTSKLIKPVLSIDIPTVKFTDAIIDGDTIKINYLGDYIAGLYKYLLGISTLIAIVMLMIGGLQYTIFQEDKAKTRIKNAVTGLVLLLSTYLILITVNPRLVVFPQLVLENIEADSLGEIEDASVNGTLVTEFASPSQSNISGPGINEIGTNLADALDTAAKTLEGQGFGMRIADSFRTVAEQTAAINKYCKNPPGSASCDPKDGKTEVCMLLNNDPVRCPHTSGQALDIWGTKLGSESQCITKASCNSKLGDKDPCRLNECQAALITAMKDAGFCNLSIEAWHFEMPRMSTRCN